MNIVVLGKFGKAYGLEGWQFFPHSMEDPHLLLGYDYDALFVQPPGQSWQKAAGSPQIKAYKDTFIIKMPDVDNREGTLDYLNGLLGIERAHLPQPAEGSYYWSDLIGMSVINTVCADKESTLGKVLSLQRCGSKDVMEIGMSPKGGKQQYMYIPFVLPEPVTQVDLHNKRIYVSWDTDY